VPVQPVERKLAAIFAADIAGYSRLMARDEVGTLARLKACRAIIDELIASHRGRIFNTAGDSVVADFASAVDAVQCAVAVQAAIATENAGGTSDEPMQFRIGVHVGDVIVEGSNLLGDSVNIAARLEALAEPGSIYVSAPARDHIGNKLPLAFDNLGDQQIKNIEQAIRAAVGVYLESVECIDVFAGKGIGQDSRSMAVSMAFRAPDRTLSSDEVAAWVETLIAHLAANFGAELRGQ